VGLTHFSAVFFSRFFFLEPVILNIKNTHKMWSAITQAITRDLSEFASVVSSDAAQLLNDAAAGGGLMHRPRPVAGDEDYPEVRAILELLSDGDDDDEHDDHTNSSSSSDDEHAEGDDHRHGSSSSSGRRRHVGEETSRVAGSAAHSTIITTVRRLQTTLDTFRIALTPEEHQQCGRTTNVRWIETGGGCF
jgi:hypothetical protein